MEDKEKVTRNNRDRAKAAFTKVSNFINDDKQLIKKHDLMNKL